MSESPLIASLPTSSAVTAPAGWPTTASSATEAAQRRRTEAEQSDTAPRHPVVAVELHRDRGARDGEIAVAAGEFLDREAGPAAPHREPHRRQDLVGRQRRLPQAGEELGRRDLPVGLETTSPPSSRRARAPPRRTRRRGRRARSRRPVCPGSGSGSGRCRASTTSAAARNRPPRRPCRPARAAFPPPIHSSSSRSSMFFSSSIREMSMRFSKYVSRIASIGTRLCPPARILASSPNSPSICTASATVSGRW